MSFQGKRNLCDRGWSIDRSCGNPLFFFDMKPRLSAFCKSVWLSALHKNISPAVVVTSKFHETKFLVQKALGQQALLREKIPWLKIPRLKIPVAFNSKTKLKSK